MAKVQLQPAKVNGGDTAHGLEHSTGDQGMTSSRRSPPHLKLHSQQGQLWEFFLITWGLVSLQNVISY